MDRRKRCHALDCSLQLRRDEGWLPVFAPAVYNAVAHDVDFRNITKDTRLTAAQGVQQVIRRQTTRPYRVCVLHRFALCRHDLQFRLVAVPLDLSRPIRLRGNFGHAITDFVETALLAAGPRVKNQKSSLYEIRDRVPE